MARRPPGGYPLTDRFAHPHTASWRSWSAAGLFHAEGVSALLAFRQARFSPSYGRDVDSPEGESQSSSQSPLSACWRRPAGGVSASG